MSRGDDVVDSADALERGEPEPGRPPRRRRGDGRGPRATKSLELERLWRWLPIFRVVAEHESVGEASRLLCLSASSVSRSVRLLEEDLGKTLFTRLGGRLALNDAGHEFLEAVRRSMRLVDDGADLVRGGGGLFRIAAQHSVFAQLLPAIACYREMQGAAARPLFVRQGGSHREVAAGILDLLVVAGRTNAGTLEVHRLGELRVGAFVAPDHAMLQTPARGFSSAALHGWITAPNEFPDSSCWPLELRRTSGLELSDCLAARAACVQGLGPALLPRHLVAQQLAERQLVEVPELEFPAVAVYALRRPRLVADPAETMIACLRDAFASAAPAFEALRVAEPREAEPKVAARERAHRGR